MIVSMCGVTDGVLTWAPKVRCFVVRQDLPLLKTGVRALLVTSHAGDAPVAQTLFYLN